MGILYGPVGEDGTRTPIPALNASADQVIVPNSSGQSVTEALAGKAAATHTHTASQITTTDGTTVETELSQKADKGTPTRLLLDTFESGYSPLLGGWDYGYSKDEMGNVWLSLAVKADSGNFPASEVHVCTLPEGYRPVVTIPVVAQALQGVRDVSILVAIQLDGKVMFYIPSETQARPAYGFTVMFRAAQ